MSKFLLKIVLFFMMIVIALVLSLFFVPDVVSKNSLLAAVVDKHGVLANIKGEKIIFIGGSNISFGLDSKRITEEYRLPVINLGVHAGMGLKYCMNDAKPYINKEDVVVLVPEYENFYTDNFYGEMELVSVLFDIDPAGRKTVDNEQWEYLIKYMPTYSAKKIKNYISHIMHTPANAGQVDIYHRNSFNEYGDAFIHWTMPDQNYAVAKKNNGKEKLNPAAISFIKEYKEYVVGKGARFMILPPVIEQRSYENQQAMIDAINVELYKNGIGFSSMPEKYRLPGDHFFNSYYHPNKKGVDLRTGLVIKDLHDFLDKPER